MSRITDIISGFEDSNAVLTLSRADAESIGIVCDGLRVDVTVAEIKTAMAPKPIISTPTSPAKPIKAGTVKNKE